jgi:hypothetical protein
LKDSSGVAANPSANERTNNRSGFCGLHGNQNFAVNTRKKVDHDRKTSDPAWRLYGSRWEKFKHILVANGNVICARIVDREQCRVPVEIFHHLISPKNRPDLMFCHENVIPLCRQHHPIADTPDWKPGIDFVSTRCPHQVFKEET